MGSWPVQDWANQWWVVGLSSESGLSKSEPVGPSRPVGPNPAARLACPSEVFAGRTDASRALPTSCVWPVQVLAQFPPRRTGSGWPVQIHTVQIHSGMERVGSPPDVPLDAHVGRRHFGLFAGARPDTAGESAANSRVPRDLPLDSLTDGTAGVHSQALRSRGSDRNQVAIAERVRTAAPAPATAVSPNGRQRPRHPSCPREQHVRVPGGARSLGRARLPGGSFARHAPRFPPVRQHGRRFDADGVERRRGHRAGQGSLRPARSRAPPHQRPNATGWQTPGLRQPCSRARAPWARGSVTNPRTESRHRRQGYAGHPASPAPRAPGS